MRLSDPATAITDYMLAIECSVFAALLYLNSFQQVSILLWATAFVALAASSLSGGIYHHLRLDLSTRARMTLWHSTAIPMLTALALFLSAGVMAGVAGSWKLILILLIVAGFGFGIHWMRRAGGEQFGVNRSVPILFAVLLMLSLLLARQWLRGGAGSGINILTGSVICVVGGLVQQAAPKIHRHFNHNDLCHIFFMPGLYFLFRGGLLLRDQGL